MKIITKYSIFNFLNFCYGMKNVITNKLAIGNLFTFLCSGRYNFTQTIPEI